MPNQEPQSRQNQFGIRSALVATGGIACFAACCRLMFEIGVPGVLLATVMIPGTAGTFYGLGGTKTGRRSALLGSLMGCTVSLVPSVAWILLIATAGLAQRSTELTTIAGLGLFAALLCVLVSGVVGCMFAVSRALSVA